MRAEVERERVSTGRRLDTEVDEPMSSQFVWVLAPRFVAEVRRLARRQNAVGREQRSGRAFGARAATPPC